MFKDSKVGYSVWTREHGFMDFNEWCEKHAQVLLGGRLLASNEKLKAIGRPLYDDAQPQWEPIETAPKSKSSEDDDMEMILLFVSHNHIDWGYVVVGFWNPDTECWCNNVDGGQEFPVYWAPLLAPPYANSDYDGNE